jgi:hypothetical protein
MKLRVIIMFVVIVGVGKGWEVVRLKVTGLKRID